jgi:hypothetical protein
VKYQIIGKKARIKEKKIGFQGRKRKFEIEVSGIPKINIWNSEI